MDRFHIPSLVYEIHFIYSIIAKKPQQGKGKIHQKSTNILPHSVKECERCFTKRGEKSQAGGLQTPRSQDNTEKPSDCSATAPVLSRSYSRHCIPTWLKAWVPF